jgi:hypothetical protein
VELTVEYEPYFCSVEGAITIVIVGTFCGFRNLKQIQEWASHEKIQELLAEIRNKKIGMIMQDFALVEDFSCIENTKKS